VVRARRRSRQQRSGPRARCRLRRSPWPRWSALVGLERARLVDAIVAAGLRYRIGPAVTGIDYARTVEDDQTRSVVLVGVGVTGSRGCAPNLTRGVTPQRSADTGS
jgi:hypothetical protein